MKKKNRRDPADGPDQDVLGPLQDLVRQLRSGVRTKQQLVDFNEGRNPFLKKAEAASLVPFEHDKTTKDGWTLMEPGPELDGKTFVLELVEFLKPGESSVNGEVMKQRAKELNAHLGQRHAEYLLKHQELIPTEWRGKYILTFPGTVWQDSDGDRRGPYLLWHGDRWCLYFRWLRYGWDSLDRLVRLRK